jgi:magnesium chelatase family protein
MATIIPSIGLKGMEGYRVQVEVQLLHGLEGISIVGLPDASVKESKDRVIAALYANDCQLPDKARLQSTGGFPLIVSETYRGISAR